MASWPRRRAAAGEPLRRRPSTAAEGAGKQAPRGRHIAVEVRWCLIGTREAWRSGLIARRGAQLGGNGGHELGHDGERQPEGGWGVLWYCLACYTREGAAGRGRRHGRAAVQWGTRHGHGRHVQGRCRRFRQFVEYVSRVDVPDLETIFGPARVRIWTWANYESCSFHDALQILFKHHGHKTHRLGDNQPPNHQCQHVKLGQIDPNFLHVVLQQIISNFHFWTNLSYLVKT
jgi:hypothetical protein